MTDGNNESEAVQPLPEGPTDEELEQQEYRRKLEENVAQAQAQRSGEEPTEERHVEPTEPVREWEPPEEAGMTAETGRLLVRLLIFFVGVFGLYVLVQQVIDQFYSPRIRSVQAVVPDERIQPGTSARVGILARNSGEMDGAAFVIVALPDGREFEGQSVTVPGNDTATAWVDVPFDTGIQVFSLILYDGWRGVERLTTIPGLTVEVGEHMVQIEEVEIPETAAVGDTLAVTLSVPNTGELTERVRPVVLVSAEGADRPMQFPGDEVEVLPGDTANLTVSFPVELEPGAYLFEVILVSDTRRRVAGMDSAVEVDIRE